MLGIGIIRVSCESVIEYPGTISHGVNYFIFNKVG